MLRPNCNFRNEAHTAHTHTHIPTVRLFGGVSVRRFVCARGSACLWSWRQTVWCGCVSMCVCGSLLQLLLLSVGIIVLSGCHPSCCVHIAFRFQSTQSFFFLPINFQCQMNILFQFVVSACRLRSNDFFFSNISSSSAAICLHIARENIGFVIRMYGIVSLSLVVFQVL